MAADNKNANSVSYWPENCLNVIAVAGSDRTGKRASYSNFGAVIDVSAPSGVGSSADGLYSVTNLGTTSAGGASYAYINGNSFAAPQVAAIAALMLAKKPTLTPAKIESLIKSTARAMMVSCPEGCGAGIIDANAAVGAAITSP